MRENAEIDDVDGSEPMELTPIDDKSRFLTCRTKVNAENDYHRCHNPKSIAVIPECQLNVPDDEADRDECIGEVPEDGLLTDEDDERLKRELAHLPFDTSIQLLNLYNYDVDRTIEVGKELVVPDLIPTYVKEMFAANVAVERSINPSRGLPYKTFYFSKELRNVATTQQLVEFYYSEKNRLDSNWRLEREGTELDEQEDKELIDMLRENRICFVKSEGFPPRQTRYQRAVATRRANQIRKDDVPDSVGDPLNSDKPFEQVEKSPSPMEENECSERVLRRSEKSATASTRSSLENHTPPKKRRHRKSGEEHRVGPRRYYPNRKRHPRAFFE